MKTHGIRAVIIEDKFEERSRARKSLEEAGIAVIAEATTLDEARVIIPKLTELSVNYVILDGNLSENDMSGNDGRVLFDEIRLQAHETVVFGWSKSSRFGDISVSKRDKEADLGKIVTDFETSRSCYSKERK